jgi:hypothetical protein
MTLAEKHVFRRRALPVVYDAVRAAKSEHRLLAVHVEAQRLLRAHPDLRVTADQLAEDIARVAAFARVALQIG